VVTTVTAAAVRSRWRSSVRRSRSRCVRLEEANLQGAQLDYANLQVAQLNRAKLQHARLDRANLHDATANETTTWPEGWTPEEHGVEWVD
jgi:uncharacterized protein YjbI with pentapeptide repeats